MTSVVAREGSLEDQDCERLRKGKVVAKDLQITHPTNASTISYIGNNTREPTICKNHSDHQKSKPILLTREQLSKKKMCFRKLVNNY
jgi:hypothetical protein